MTEDEYTELLGNTLVRSDLRDSHGPFENATNAATWLFHEEDEIVWDPLTEQEQTLAFAAYQRIRRERDQEVNDPLRGWGNGEGQGGELGVGAVMRVLDLGGGTTDAATFRTVPLEPMRAREEGADKENPNDSNTGNAGAGDAENLVPEPTLPTVLDTARATRGFSDTEIDYVILEVAAEQANFSRLRRQRRYF